MFIGRKLFFALLEHELSGHLFLCFYLQFRRASDPDTLWRSKIRGLRQIVQLGTLQALASYRYWRLQASIASERDNASADDCGSSVTSISIDKPSPVSVLSGERISHSSDSTEKPLDTFSTVDAEFRGCSSFVDPERVLDVDVPSPIRVPLSTWSSEANSAESPSSSEVLVSSSPAKSVSDRISETSSASHTVTDDDPSDSHACDDESEDAELMCVRLSKSSIRQMSQKTVCYTHEALAERLEQREKHERKTTAEDCEVVETKVRITVVPLCLDDRRNESMLVTETGGKFCSYRSIPVKYSNVR